MTPRAGIDHLLPPRSTIHRSPSRWNVVAGSPVAPRSRLAGVTSKKLDSLTRSCTNLTDRTAFFQARGSSTPVRALTSSRKRLIAARCARRSCESFSRRGVRRSLSQPAAKASPVSGDATSSSRSSVRASNSRARICLASSDAVSAVMTCLASSSVSPDGWDGTVLCEQPAKTLRQTTLDIVNEKSCFIARAAGTMADLHGK